MAAGDARLWEICIRKLLYGVDLDQEKENQYMLHVASIEV